MLLGETRSGRAGEHLELRLEPCAEKETGRKLAAI